MSQDYQTRQPHTEEGNLFRPICTSHNSHTHTDNTRQPEPQLKSSSCLSAILSNNSRDAIPIHNSRNATYLTPIPSHNSRNTSKSTFKISSKSCRPCTSKVSKTQFLPLQYCLALLLSRQAKHASRPPGGGHVPLGAKHHYTYCLCNYRLVERTPSGATRSQSYCNCNYRMAGQLYRQALH